MHFCKNVITGDATAVDVPTLTVSPDQTEFGVGTPLTPTSGHYVF